MAYPSSYDSFPTLVDGQPAYAVDFNMVYTAVQAIQSTLGLNPQGSYGSVQAALSAANTTPGATGPTWPAGPSGPTGPSGVTGPTGPAIATFLLMGC